MKKQLLAMGAIVICCLFMQCNKEEKNVEPNQPDTTTNNNNGDKDNNDQDDPDLTTSCGTVGDNQIMLGDEIFKKDTETANSYLNICMEYDFAQTGTPFLKHERSLYFEDGD